MSGNRWKLAFFEGGGSLCHFRRKGASPTNHCWFQSSRVIALSCGIKISAVHHLVLVVKTVMFMLCVGLGLGLKIEFFGLGLGLFSWSC